MAPRELEECSYRGPEQRQNWQVGTCKNWQVERNPEHLIVGVWKRKPQVFPEVSPSRFGTSPPEAAGFWEWSGGLWSLIRERRLENGRPIYLTLRWQPSRQERSALFSTCCCTI